MDTQLAVGSRSVGATREQHFCQILCTVPSSSVQQGLVAVVARIQRDMADFQGRFDLSCVACVGALETRLCGLLLLQVRV
jgi:hypothetical protein